MKNNISSRSLQRKYYDEVYRGSGHVRGAPSKEPYYFTERFLDMCNISKKSVVLEIGCGGGRLTTYLLKRCGSVYAVDISTAAIEGMQARFESAITSGNLTLACADTVDFLDSCSLNFSAVVGSGIIHHIESSRRRDFFSKVYSKLKAGGTFACGPEPNADGFYFYLWCYLVEFLYKMLYHAEYDRDTEAGVLSMKSTVLLRELNEAGFSNAEILPYQVLPHFSSEVISCIDRKLVDVISGKVSLYTIIRGTKPKAS